jgi:hypothetical protein
MKYNFENIIKYSLTTLDTDVNKLVAYRLESHSSLDDSQFVKTGFCSLKEVSKFLKKGKIPPYNEWCMVTHILLEHLQQNGFIMNDGLNKEYYEDSFTAFKEQAGILVRFDNDAHMVFDSTGEPLPVAIHFDYINSIENESYNLELVSSILSSRKDILILKDIHDIPYYNACNGCTKTINFLWQPSVEDYRKMWNKCLLYGSKYPSCEMHQAVFDEDLLGLRAGGASKFDSYAGKYSEEGGVNYET